MPRQSLNGALVYWLLGALFAIIMAMGGWMVTSANAAQSEVRVIVNQQGQRISRVEASVDGLKDETLRRLDRIESKLDQR